MKPLIVFSYPVYISFVRKDEALLKKNFRVVSFWFNQTPTSLLLSFIRQFIQLLSNYNTKAYVSFFAGYSSFLPALFARITNKPHILILGGTDASSIPEIDYGNYRKRILGFFTRKSVEWSTHLLPVSKNLIDSEYTYTSTTHPKQGIKNFCKIGNQYIEVVPIGYDSNLFSRKHPKENNLFLCVAQLNKANYYRKGIDLIFQLAQSFPEYQFLIVGNTGMHFDQLPKNLSIIPGVSYDELVKYYSRARYYLQLSMMEGFPSAPCEAMLCECVPIVSAVGAMPDIVGDCGFIVYHKDINEITSAVQKAIACDAEELGKKARQRIISNYPMHVRERFVEIIQSAITSPPQS